MSEHTYRDGEAIYRAGDPSGATFLLLQGQVELAEGGESRQVSPGEIFGDDELPGDPRAATATARGEVIVQHLGGGPTANLPATVPAARPVQAAASTPARGLWQGLRRALSRPAPPPRRPAGMPRLFALRAAERRAPRNQRFDVQLATLAGQNSTAAVRQLMDLLNQDRHLKAARVLTPLAIPAEGSAAARLGAVHAQARHLLAASGADLLLLCDVPREGNSLSLRVVAPARADDGRPGTFHPLQSLDLPLPLPAALGPVLRAVCFATPWPRMRGQRTMQVERLVATLDQAATLDGRQAQGLSAAARVGLKTAYGNAAAAAAGLSGSAQWYRKAVDSLRGAEAELPPDRLHLQRGLVRHSLGSVLAILAEEDDDGTALLEEAERLLAAAIEDLRPDRTPGVWAAAHLRLGDVLYRLDRRAGSGPRLRESVAATQAALRVLAADRWPQLWIEGLNQYAQSAQVLGRTSNNAKLIESAVEACRTICGHRDRARTPLPWAAAQNNLGSALFLLAQETGRREPVEEAREAFANARQVYNETGQGRAADVAARNLKRVDDLAKRLGLRPAAAPRPAKEHWSEEGEERT
ncbi:MAG: cyclic nucleotide-binding domain-containing protein [Hyphomicrobiales bacterium]|nr:cyclic nucleotide-binding domain-containing protein [Hyphomicrobiales bacterium]MCP5373348.1 cyclic nucleotide-binding domain-containing protein [Hyphomicrobiales bacterium]